MSVSILDEVLQCAEAGDLEPLIFKLEWMQAPLTDCERQFLAEYLRGAKRKPANRPKASPRIRWEALRIIDIILCEERNGGTREYAKELAAKVCNLDKRTIDRRLKYLRPGDEQERKQRLEQFHAMCDELEKMRPGRGEWQRRVKMQQIMAGELYRAARVRTKSP